MAYIYGIDNIKEILLLSYNHKLIFIEPNAFMQSIGGNIDRGGNLKLGCSDWETRPANAYKINNYDILTESSRHYKDYNGSGGDIFNYDDGATHDNDDKYYACTKFYNLYSDGRMTDEKKKINDYGFYPFNSDINARENWIADEKGRYSSSHARNFRRFWRVYYRTWEDYYTYLNCGKKNLNLYTYNNNSECKAYLDKNINLVSEKCLVASEDQLFTIACETAIKNDPNYLNRERIMKRRMDYCKINGRLTGTIKCNTFLNSRPENLSENDKKDLDSYVERNYCGSSLNINDKNYPQPNPELCTCVNEIRPEKLIEYRDANDQKGEIKFIPGVCNTIECQLNNKAYKKFNNDDAINSCPKNICIQNQEMKNIINASNLSQNCNIGIPNQNALNNPIINNIPSDKLYKPNPDLTNQKNNIPLDKLDKPNIITKLDPISEFIETILPNTFPIVISENYSITHIHFLIIFLCLIFILFPIQFNKNKLYNLFYF
jgi:hypothetical protein